MKRSFAARLFLFFGLLLGVDVAIAAPAQPPGSEPRRTLTEWGIQKGKSADYL